MIKNLLYSFFLHLILLLIIYLNFNNKKLITIDDKEFTISAIIIEEKKPKEVKKEPKPEIKEIIKPKKETIDEPIKKLKKEPQKPKKVLKKKNKKPKKKKIKKKKIIKKDLKQVVTEESQDNEAELDSSKDIANINLSAREKLNLTSQIKRCYIWATNQTNYKNKIKIKFSISISEFGFIESNIDKIIDKKRFKRDLDYQKSITNAKKTIELCNPIRNLPHNKFDILKEINIEIGE